MLLKNEARVEAFFFLYGLALCVAGLIERDIRRGMHREGLAELPLYPEHRACRRPTYEQIPRLFAHAARHTLRRRGRLIEVFHPQLTPLQRHVLHLLGVPTRAYGAQRPEP